MCCVTSFNKGIEDYIIFLTNPVSHNTLDDYDYKYTMSDVY